MRGDQCQVKLIRGSSPLTKSGGEISPLKSGGRSAAKNMKVSKPVAPKRSAKKAGENTGAIKKSLMPAAEITTKETKIKSLLASGPMQLAEKLPVIFGNLNLNSPEGKLQQLSLLDDTLMSLSLVADSLQKRASRESEMHNPETVTALCATSKEIRSLIQLKLEIAKELAGLEFRKIRLAMQIEEYMRGGGQ